MEHAAALLSASGWPDNDRPLDSVEFQLQDRWQELLDHIATLDFTGDQVDFSTALATLETEATQTLFAPRSHHAPVQIMEPLESAGSAWDKLFFLGATDMLWPARTSTHPLIPFSVQQQFAMPGAEPAHTLRDAVAITQRIAASAAVATFSYVQRNSEGEQRPSPCLHELPNVVELHSEPTTPAPDATIALEAAPDDAPLPALPDKVVRGGAAILKLQAQCPFRAFAERRLFSSPLDEIEPGLDPGERGNLLHQVMAAFWDKVRTQQALRQMTTEAQLEALKLAVNVALAKPTATATTPWQLRYLDVQREWLHDLLPDWLEVEMTERPPFQVLHTEFNLEDRSIGPLRLDARVDRIDAMLDDAHPIASDASPQVILDYKTGNIPSKPWDGDRPDEPQLPLYAVLAGDIPVHGIAFARLKAGKIALDECSGPEFNSRLEDWRRVLTNLAEVFVRGNTAVDPKTTDSCRNCAQAALCRIHEHPLTGDSLDD
jgi:probable DNA repair protein